MSAFGKLKKETETFELTEREDILPKRSMQDDNVT